MTRLAEYAEARELTGGLRQSHDRRVLLRRARQAAHAQRDPTAAGNSDLHAVESAAKVPVSCM